MPQVYFSLSTKVTTFNFFYIDTCYGRLREISNQEPRGPSDRDERASPRDMNKELSYSIAGSLGVLKTTGGNNISRNIFAYLKYNHTLQIMSILG